MFLSSPRVDSIFSRENWFSPSADLSLATQELSSVTVLFAITWSWTPLSYINFESAELPNFYPAFQVMNSWMGAFYFLIVGIGSKRFRTVIAGNVMRRQLMNRTSSEQE